MLAQNFKSAEDLDIPEALKQALIKTLVLFETGKITHRLIPEDPCIGDGMDFDGKFNMQIWSTEWPECGTIACIGGITEMVSGINIGWVPDSLQNLFSPDRIPFREWARITPEQAARAIRSYLTTGEANWEEICLP